ncbi:hypothetical protein MP228_007716 [Amoeboaphelidium protococcarum]|nr:hypothetical protein MP228_007716 [Amoeboaphelidium protococcarum]
MKVTAAVIAVVAALSQSIEAGSFHYVPPVAIEGSPMIVSYCSKNLQLNPARLNIVIQKHIPGFFGKKAPQEDVINHSEIKYLGPDNSVKMSRNQCFLLAFKPKVLPAYQSNEKQNYESKSQYVLKAKTADGFLSGDTTFGHKSTSKPFQIVPQFEQLQDLSRVGNSQIDSRQLRDRVHQKNMQVRDQPGAAKYFGQPQQQQAHHQQQMPRGQENPHQQFEQPNPFEQQQGEPEMSQQDQMGNARFPEIQEYAQGSQRDSGYEEEEEVPSRQGSMGRGNPRLEEQESQQLPPWMQRS